MVKRVGKYEIGRTLGEGTFGKVKYAINVETGEAVAIKVLDKEKIQKQNMGNQIKKEISIMKMVVHKYIVGLIEVLASKTKIFIVLELIQGGELFDKIVKSGKLSEKEAKFYFSQLVEGVEYCHKQGVCHRDLKPENLLLDEHGNLKISDFGLSSLYTGDPDGDGAHRTQILHTTCGTPNYVAPEVLADEGYDGKKADVWSIGVILYVLLAGFLPFDEGTIVELFKKIKKAVFTYPPNFPPEVRSLVDSMLVADPKERITLAKVKEHSWLREAVFTPRPLVVDPVPNPTPKQVQGAVDGADEHDGDEDETPRHPIQLNAFELMSKCGGGFLEKLFSPHIFATVEESGASAAASGVVHFGAQKRASCYHFTSMISPPEELIKQVYHALSEMGFAFMTDESTVVTSGKARCNLLSPKGMVSIIVQVFSIGPAASLLELKRGKGDLLEWNKLIKELLDTKISHIVCKSNESDESKSDIA